MSIKRYYYFSYISAFSLEEQENDPNREESLKQIGNQMVFSMENGNRNGFQLEIHALETSRF